MLHSIQNKYLRKKKCNLKCKLWTLTHIHLDISSMTIFAEANVDVDLRMLRSFRVLRPLKLVSRIPSKPARLSASERHFNVGNLFTT